MKSAFTSLLMVLAVGTLFAQTPKTPTPTIMIPTNAAALAALAQENGSFRLWSGAAPGALGEADKDIPTLTPFLPKQPAPGGPVMVIFPGGGYAGLADHEGKDYALWLNDQGVTALVLKYRLGSGGYHHPVELGDAARAVRIVRANAAAWNLDAHRIGVMGSSAGGHLASTLMTHFDAGDAKSSDPIEQVSSRPNLGILCYPVITLEKPWAHEGSKKNLLGENPSPELVSLLSNEKQVTRETPHCFIFHTAEDKTVPVENSLNFALALSREHVPFDLHIYEKGGHGGGLMGKSRAHYEAGKTHPWVADCVYWLKAEKFIP